MPAPRSLEEKLAENNLQRREVIGHDSNSFFNAVSEALTNTPIQLRERLVKHLKTHQDLYFRRSGATTPEEYKKLCSLDDPLSSNMEQLLPEAMAQTLRMQIQAIPVNSEQEDKFYGTEPLIHDKTDIDHCGYVLPITSPGDTTNTSEASPPGTTETPPKSSKRQPLANTTQVKRTLFPEQR